MEILVGSRKTSPASAFPIMVSGSSKTTLVCGSEGGESVCSLSSSGPRRLPDPGEDVAMGRVRHPARPHVTETAGRFLGISKDPSTWGGALKLEGARGLKGNYVIRCVDQIPRTRKAMHV